MGNGAFTDNLSLNLLFYINILKSKEHISVVSLNGGNWEHKLLRECNHERESLENCLARELVLISTVTVEKRFRFIGMKLTVIFFYPSLTPVLHPPFLTNSFSPSPSVFQPVRLSVCLSPSLSLFLSLARGMEGMRDGEEEREIERDR